MLSHAALVDLLWSTGACDSGREWVERQRGSSPIHIWLNCQRPDWMLWFAHVAGIEQAHIIGVLGDVLELVRPNMLDLELTQLSVARFKDWAAGAEVDLEEFDALRLRLENNLSPVLYPVEPGSLEASAVRQAFRYLHNGNELHAAGCVESAYYSLKDRGDEKTARHIVPLIRNRISWEMLEQALVLRGQE